MLFETRAEKFARNHFMSDKAQKMFKEDPSLASKVVEVCCKMTENSTRMMAGLEPTDVEDKTEEQFEHNGKAYGLKIVTSIGLAGMPPPAPPRKGFFARILGL